MFCFAMVALFFAAERAAAGGNLVTLGSGEGANGKTLGIRVDLDNDTPMKALQLDLSYDSSVVQFDSGSGAARGANLIATFASSGPGRFRMVFHFDGNGQVPIGSGQIGVLQFRLVGGKNSETTLLPSGLVFSDPQAEEVPVTGVAGSILVTTGPPEVPTFQIVALKNPGRTRTFQAFVRIENGSGAAPFVTVNAAPVTVESPSVGLYTFTYFMPSSVDAVTIFVSDTNSDGTGTDQRVVTVP